MLLQINFFNLGKNSSFNFKKTRSEKKTQPSLLRLRLNIWPDMENIRSTAAEEAWTPRYFIASVARLGKRT